eukprot:10741080-Heterocapsa_arctica.AAC.1
MMAIIGMSFQGGLIGFAWGDVTLCTGPLLRTAEIFVYKLYGEPGTYVAGLPGITVGGAKQQLGPDCS